mmetsp:Transcript_43098/g.91518  ORF Transcript_43098/g.91518 Transcript_43098/m.91518 type:complete len:270 (-) Transcript_43098:61-870(-)
MVGVRKTATESSTVPITKWPKSRSAASTRKRRTLYLEPRNSLSNANVQLLQNAQSLAWTTYTYTICRHITPTKSTTIATIAERPPSPDTAKTATTTCSGIRSSSETQKARAARTISPKNVASSRLTFMFAGVPSSHRATASTTKSAVRTAGRHFTSNTQNKAHDATRPSTMSNSNANFLHCTKRLLPPQPQIERSQRRRYNKAQKALCENPRQSSGGNSMGPVEALGCEATSNWRAVPRSPDGAGAGLPSSNLAREVGSACHLFDRDGQ